MKIEGAPPTFEVRRCDRRSNRRWPPDGRTHTHLISSEAEGARTTPPFLMFESEHGRNHTYIQFVILRHPKLEEVFPEFSHVQTFGRRECEELPHLQLFGFEVGRTSSSCSSLPNHKLSVAYNLRLRFSSLKTVPKIETTLRFDFPQDNKPRFCISDKQLICSLVRPNILGNV